MEVFLYTFNGVSPVFVVILLGVFLQRLGFFSEKTKDELVKLVFYVGTPALLFNSVASASLYEAFNPRFVSFILISILLLIALIIALCFFIKDKAKKAAVIQLGFRSNFAIVGMPLAKYLLPESGVSQTAVMLSFVVITYNVMVSIILSYYTGKERNLKAMFTSIIKNPLIIGTAAGLIFAVLQIKNPKFIVSSLDIVGQTAMSVGLLVLGATITLKGFVENRFYILYSVFLRNIMSPLLFVTAAVLLGFNENELIITAIMSAAPSAVNCFVMAKKMGADAEITAYGVSFTSVFSMFSIFLSVYLIKLFGS